MIAVAWRPELAAGEVAELERMIAAAVHGDAEAGFSTAVALTPGDPTSSPRRFQAVARLGTPSAGPGGDALAAYLRVDVTSAGAGTAQLLVDPARRSLGIGTLMLERIGLDLAGPGGWAGTGASSLRIWAHGSHPAAGRMARRFGARAVRTLWKLVGPAGPGSTMRSPGRSRISVGLTPVAGEALIAGVAAADVTHCHAAHPNDARRLAAARDLLVARDPAGAVLGMARISIGRAPDLGAIAELSAAAGADRRAVVAALLQDALTRIQADGDRRVAMHVDPADGEIVAVARRFGFVHEHSDVCYGLDLPGSAPPAQRSHQAAG